jgi:acyl carrier protein
MEWDASTIRTAIREKLIEIADGLGADARPVADEDIIPATGVLDSAGIFELIAWYEQRFDLILEQAEINIDNLGSVHRMADYVVKRKKAQE